MQQSGAHIAASREDAPHRAGVADPIFIVGAPRSGTTLLRAMLNRHPNVALCDETYYFYYVMSRQRRFGDLGNPENRRRVVGRYLETHRIRRLGLEPTLLSETLLREGTDYASLFVSLMRLYTRVHGKERYGEKTPQHSLFAAELRRLYPGCRIIHLVRDPRDVVASLMRMPWGGKSALANARLWRSYVLAAEACSQSEGFLRVHYERLVEDTETELRRVCRFIGEPFSEQMLSAKPGAQSDYWWFQRAHEPLTRNRVESWREELDPEQAALVEWAVGEPMRSMGYTPSGDGPSRSLLAAAMVREGGYAVWSRVRNIPRLWYYWARPTHLAAEEAWIDRTGLA